jgi:hypothetical protein
MADARHAPPSPPAPQDDPLAEAQAKLREWEAYLALQQERRREAAAALQRVMDESGLSQRGIDPTSAEFAEIAFDPEFQRQVSLHYGLKLDKAEPVDTSKPDVSRWRQRTRAMKV